MGRLWMLGLAATVLPACGEYKIWVSNAGGADARVDVRYKTVHEIQGFQWTESHDDAWVVAPGRAEGKRYPPATLDVRISRVSDGATLLDDRFTYEDFRDEHSRIELTVYP